MGKKRKKKKKSPSLVTGRDEQAAFCTYVLYGSHGVLADTSTTDVPKICSLGQGTLMKKIPQSCSSCLCVSVYCTYVCSIQMGQVLCPRMSAFGFPSGYPSSHCPPPSHPLSSIPPRTLLICMHKQGRSPFTIKLPFFFPWRYRDPQYSIRRSILFTLNMPIQKRFESYTHLPLQKNPALSISLSLSLVSYV